MNELARNAGGDAGLPETRAYVAPPEAGPIPLIGRGVRRLFGPKSLEFPAAEVVASGREAERAPGAHHSAMDAGITGGMSLLNAGFGNERRR